MPAPSARLALAAATVLAAAVPAFLIPAPITADQSTDLTILPLDNPAIQYAKAPADDAVIRLEQRLAEGKAKLDYQPGIGYLPSLLKNLDLNPDSQSLVFSKTSFQAAKISPSNPRALFFNDDVMLGSVRGGDVLELAALDPRQGMVFYTLDMQKTDRPQFIRRDSCLQCHQGPATLGVPGLLIGSVYPDSSGMPSSRSNNPVTDDTTSIQKRWGGWYVSGDTGGMTHMGNAVARDPRAPDVLSPIKIKFEPTGYVSETSDVVALMVLEHETRVVNLMIRAGWDARLGHPIDADVDALVHYMLFAHEATLYDPIVGVSAFTQTFQAEGPRDKQGRSLRQLDLQKRLFRYPLSYMLYSPTFDDLPDTVRAKVYQGLYDVLSGKNQDAAYAKTTEEDRKAILEIVRETKSNVPDYWKN